MAFNWFKKKEKQSQDNSDVPSSVSEQSEKQAESHTPVETDETPSPSQDAAPPLPADDPTDDETLADGIAKDSQQKVEEPLARKGFFGRLKQGLSKTRDILTTDIEDIFNGKSGVDDEMLENLEELLITSDMGVSTTMDLMEKIEKKASRIKGPKELQQTIKSEIVKLFDDLPPKPDVTIAKPHVVMVIGVNGVGKTTTIGKLAAKAANSGQKVLIAAADTFRAAAIEQLTVWAERSGADIVKHKANADPSAVVYDSVEAAVARGADIVFVDTAGRLHTKVNLMEELKKIQRTMAKKLPDAPHEILLVLDATTGQNALSQAKLFNEAIGITGLVLTKLDGTAKGGIVVSICTTLNLPLKYIGVGENIEDLQDFDPHQFVDALL
jgi:fused signal recognition particle receptor